MRPFDSTESNEDTLAEPVNSGPLIDSDDFSVGSMSVSIVWRSLRQRSLRLRFHRHTETETGLTRMRFATDT